MKQKKSKTKEKVADIFTGSQVMVLLEDLRGDIKAISEKQDIMYDELQEFKTEMYEFKDEMCGFKTEMSNFKSETESNFKSVLEYLSRLEDEFIELKAAVRKIDDNKVDKDEFTAYKRRLERLENQFEKYKLLVASKVKAA